MNNSEQYFVTEDENGLGRVLVPRTSTWDARFKVIMEENGIDMLRLSHSAGWRETDLSFLESMPYLRGIQIYHWDVKDLRPLLALSELQLLGFTCLFTKGPDFSAFEKLQYLLFTWRPKAKSVFDCKGLLYLNIDGYPYEELQSVKHMTRLDRLSLSSRKLTSLSGIEHLESLNSLELVYCSQLRSVDGIERCGQLQNVELHCCKKVNDISSFLSLKHLKTLDMENCGRIKSLRPLADCKMLEYLHFVGDTNIEDGDLSPLPNLPRLKKASFAHRRHYTHRRFDVFKGNRQSFDELLKLRFFTYRGLVLISEGFTRDRRRSIDNRLRMGESAEDEQSWHNRQEMYRFASSDLSRQRAYAEELKRSWEQKLPVECPDIPAYVKVYDDGEIVILTVKNNSFRPG